jgi:hypothetical protein
VLSSKSLENLVEALQFKLSERTLHDIVPQYLDGVQLRPYCETVELCAKEVVDEELGLAGIDVDPNLHGTIILSLLQRTLSDYEGQYAQIIRIS